MHSQQFQVSCSTVVALDQIMAAVNSAKVKEGDKLVAEAEKRYGLIDRNRLSYI